MHSGATTQRHILVVDDEPLVRETLAFALRFGGHAADTAENAEQALALFAPGKYDLVITDFSMPGLQGDALALAIKQRAASQPVVMLTAYVESFLPPHRLPAGLDCVLAKPLSIETLRDTLERFCPAGKS